MPLDDLRKKWGTIFMGEREATVEELDAMQEPARRAQVRQKVQEDYMERVREKATERARQILGEAYAERQKVLAEAREEAQRQSDLILAEVERIRQSTKEGYEAMQAELQKAADIRAEAQRIRDEAARIHESAQADGHAAGVESAEGELRAFRGELGQHLAWVLQALSAQFETIDAQWREDLAELTRVAVSAATGHVMDTQHDAVVRAVLLDSLSLLENRATITVRVHPEDEKMVGTLFKAARERAPELQNWVVEGDASLELGGFIVETNSGSVDARRECFKDLVDSVLVHLALPGSDPERAVREAAEEMAQRAVQRIRALAPVEEAPEPEAPAPAVAPEALAPAAAAAEPPLENVPEDVQAEADVLSDAELDRTLTEAAAQPDDGLAEALPEEPAVAAPAVEEGAAPAENSADVPPAAEEPALPEDALEAAPEAPETPEAPEAAAPPAVAEEEALPEPRSNASRAALEDELFPLEEPPATPSVSAPAAPAAPRPKPAPATSPDILTGGGFLPGA